MTNSLQGPCKHHPEQLLRAWPDPATAPGGLDSAQGQAGVWGVCAGPGAGSTIPGVPPAQHSPSFHGPSLGVVAAEGFVSPGLWCQPSVAAVRIETGTFILGKL